MSGRGRKRKVEDEPADKPTAGTSRPSRRKKTAPAEQPDEAPVASPSTSRQKAAAIPKSTPAKRARKSKKDPDAEEGDGPENRLARFKPSCPQDIMARVGRVMSQRFFMVDRRRIDGELKEEFSVLGSTGNVYTVTIDKLPKCTCPDCRKGHHCKHILFIFLKVLHVPQSSHIWYQKALLTSELQTVFTEAPPAPETLASAQVRAAYAKATGKVLASPVVAEEDAGARRLPTQEDDCPICYEKLHGVALTLLKFCEQCKNALHNECFQQWANQCKPRAVTCVYCRAEWAHVPTAGSSKGYVEAGYFNLGSVAGLSPVRDTSTYHYPRRHY